MPINSHNINKSTEKINLQQTLGKGVVKCSVPKIAPSYVAAAASWLTKTITLSVPTNI
jgi:hypothetical protein